MSFAGVWTMATFFFGVFLCVDGPICLVSLCAGCVLSAQGAIGLASTVKVVEDERKIFCYSLVFIAVLATADLWSFIYQHEEKSGGSVLLLGACCLAFRGVCRSLGRQTPRRLAMRWSMTSFFCRIVQRSKCRIPSLIKEVGFK